VKNKDSLKYALDHSRYLIHLVASRILIPYRGRLNSHCFGYRCDRSNNQARDRSGRVN
jgi:hypothetical protein